MKVILYQKKNQQKKSTHLQRSEYDLILRSFWVRGCDNHFKKEIIIFAGSPFRSFPPSPLKCVPYFFSCADTDKIKSTILTSYIPPAGGPVLVRILALFFAIAILSPSGRFWDNIWYSSRWPAACVEKKR